MPHFPDKVVRPESVKEVVSYQRGCRWFCMCAEGWHRRFFPSGGGGGCEVLVGKWV